MRNLLQSDLVNMRQRRATMFMEREKTSRDGFSIGGSRCSEQGLEALIQGDLRESSYDGIRGVNCQLHQGVLTLLGQVSSWYHKQVAQEVARRRLSDAALIRNTLEVVTPDRGSGKDAGTWWKAEINQAE